MILTIMDYNYIKQLLERYWACETTVEEESILKAFFSQKSVPAELAKYQALFVYEATEPKTDVLGDDFDARMLAMTEEPKQVKARVITMTQRLRPLFKAAAVVAIILTLSNAFQMSFDNNGPVIGSGATNYNRILRSTVQVESSRIAPLRFMFQIVRAMYFSMSRWRRL